jgi:peptidoglycan/xylan/chitin deacetylase (PgdA/CDA1 family)
MHGEIWPDNLFRILIRAITKIFPSVTCRIRTKEKIIFLTFDDGPVPEATSHVLDMLSSYHARATFFCIGENIQNNPGIFERIIKEKHAAGNHSYHHLNGWRTPDKKYLEDITQCKKLIEPPNHLNGKMLFRPPYGKLKLSQYASLKKDYKIVMWDVLTRDWEQDRSPESCFGRIRNRAAAGSIIVFHDSIKAKARMLPALERTLKYYTESGFRFESLEKFL